MGTKFVLLASGLKISPNTTKAIERAKLNEIAAKFKPLQSPLPSPIDGIPVDGFFWSDNDGGNGGGGGNAGGLPQSVKVGELGHVFWRFPVVQSALHKEDKYPPIARHELCIPFDSYSDLVEYFQSSPGNILQDVFAWVQYVAIAEPI